jgi:hypothetical protein
MVETILAIGSSSGGPIDGAGQVDRPAGQSGLARVVNPIIPVEVLEFDAADIRAVHPHPPIVDATHTSIGIGNARVGPEKTELNFAPLHPKLGF